MSGPSHKLYLDDSGTKEYSSEGTYPSGGGRTPYFVFAGLLLTTGAAGQLSKALRKLKLDHLGTESIEIKANWLKRPAERQKRYLGPLKISDADLDNFTKSAYALLGGFQGELIAAVVDKPAVQKMYAVPWYAPTIAFECLLQRVQKAMEEVSGAVSVTVDDMTGATPKGNQYKTNLSRHHRILKTAGSQLVKSAPLDRLADLGFSDSKADERLQLADLVAYAAYRQFVDFGADWDAQKDRLPLYPYFAAIAHKFRKGPDGVMTGYGLVKFPRTTWQRWKVVPKKKP